MAQYVRDVMTSAVTAVRPDASLVEAAQLMRSEDIGDVFIADHGSLVGVLTDRDITLRAVAEGVDPLTVNVGSVCTPDVVTIRPGDTVSTAVTLMRTHAVRRLPVIENGHPIGVVTIGDLAQEQEPDSALAEISRAVPDDWHGPPRR
jgi:CBS domain-containing protein